ncbi:MAG: sulfate adenylyltransferase subunit CysN [Devosiaceae bacterium]|nr:sulfate adenylyltransferase subunit CysN [Devosiaceae bacterium]
MSELNLAKQQDLTKSTLKNLSPLRFITCGSVDDGKSTLIGRLLWDTKAVKEDQEERLRKDSRKQKDGLNLPEFALLLDGLQAEREQGITIDVAYRYFSTSKRTFIVADTPGHEQYTRNMATGASSAELAILLVDARVGILEQTKRHAMIASMMGIKQFILAVNKIDLANYDRQLFETIETEFSEFALSLGITDIISIPMCALKGENVVNKDLEHMGWYEGPTLLEALERATIRSKQTVGFRMPVQRVCRPNESFRGYQGTVSGGAVKPGDSVVILPSGIKANVTNIITFDLVRNAAVAGDAITLELDRNVDIARGDMISSIDARPLVGHNFSANIICLAQSGIVANKRYWLKSSSKLQRVVVEPISVIDLKSGQYNACDSFELNNIGKVKLRFEEEANFDIYDENPDTGSFILIDPDSNNTIAGGMISAKIEQVANIDNFNEEEIIVFSMPLVEAKKLQQLEGFKEISDKVQQTQTIKSKLRNLLSDID